jgi:hypothetical protein
MRALMIVALLFAAAPVAGQEVAVPDAPVTVTVKAYAVIGMLIEHTPEYRLSIYFTDDQGKRQEDNHVGPSYFTDPITGTKTALPEGAESLIKQLNTANMSVKSMVKRSLEHLITHGKIPPSTIQGTPQPPTSVELNNPPVIPKPPAKTMPAPVKK